MYKNTKVVHQLLLLIIMFGLVAPAARSQIQECGAWRVEWITRDVDEGIAVATLPPSPSLVCREAYRLENRTQIWGQGGYTIALQTFPFDAMIDWNPDVRAGEEIYLTKYLPVELRVTPGAIEKEGLVNLQGYMSVGSVAIDIGFLLVETALAYSGAEGCLIGSDEILFSVVFRGHDILREAARLTLIGDLLAARSEISQVGGEFLNLVVDLLQGASVSCLTEGIQAFMKRPLYLLDIGIAYFAWVATVFLNLFEHGTEPVGVYFRYLPTQETPASLTPATPILPFPGDGTIVFDSLVNGEWQVFSIRPDGSALRQLTDIAGGIGDPAISPDGSSIVFLSEGGKKMNLMDSDGGNIQNIYATQTEVGWPNWSPDSHMIVFSAMVDGYKNIFSVYADGSGLTRLTDSPSDDLAPAYSPQGDHIAFSSNRSGMWEIHVLDLVTYEVTQITYNLDPHGQGWPAWSPDGETILFEAPGNNNESDIYAIRPDGSSLVNLTNHPLYDGAPAWSPDGRQIVFASRRDGDLDLYIMQADGSQVHRLTHIWAWGPTWSHR